MLAAPRSALRRYELSIISAVEYEDLIAEIHFPGKAGVIISQEKAPGEFEISLHSFAVSVDDNFDYSCNIEDAKIPLSEFSEAIEKAVSELKRLKKI